MDWLDRGQVLALAGHIGRQLAADPGATVLGLAATVQAARETLSYYPDLDAISRCYTSPGDGCLCASGGWPHVGEPEDPPAWSAWPGPGGMPRCSP